MSGAIERQEEPPELTRVRAATLVAAHRKPGIGYEIGAELAALFADAGIRSTSNHVYGHLEWLRSAGYVEVSGVSELGPMAPKNRRGSKAAYRVTPAGLRALAAFVRSPLDEAHPLEDVKMRLRALPAPPNDLEPLRRIADMVDAYINREREAQPVIALDDAPLAERSRGDLLGGILDALSDWSRDTRSRIAREEERRR